MANCALFMIAIVFLFFSKCCISTPVVRARENIPDVPEDVTEDLCALHPELGVPGNVRKSELEGPLITLKLGEGFVRNKTIIYKFLGVKIHLLNSSLGLFK